MFMFQCLETTFRKLYTFLSDQALWWAYLDIPTSVEKQGFDFILTMFLLSLPKQLLPRSFVYHKIHVISFHRRFSKNYDLIFISSFPSSMWTKWNIYCSIRLFFLLVVHRRIQHIWQRYQYRWWMHMKYKWLFFIGWIAASFIHMSLYITLKSFICIVNYFGAIVKLKIM